MIRGEIQADTIAYISSHEFYESCLRTETVTIMQYDIQENDIQDKRDLKSSKALDVT